MTTTIQRRMDKIERLLNPQDVCFIWVSVVNGEGVFETCSKRKEDCPPLPCSKPQYCWAEQKHPNMRTIKVGWENDE